jgi:hypothetical protein
VTALNHRSQARLDIVEDSRVVIGLDARRMLGLSRFIWGLGADSLGPLKRNRVEMFER